MLALSRWVISRCVCTRELSSRDLGGVHVCEVHVFRQISALQIPYSGKLLREKTFANYVVLWLFAKVFSAKFWGSKSEQPMEVFAVKIVFSTVNVFSLESFPLNSYIASPETQITNHYGTSIGEAVGLRVRT